MFLRKIEEISHVDFGLVETHEIRPYFFHEFLQIAGFHNCAVAIHVPS